MQDLVPSEQKETRRVDSENGSSGPGGVVCIWTHISVTLLAAIFMAESMSAADTGMLSASLMMPRFSTSEHFG